MLRLMHNMPENILWAVHINRISRNFRCIQTLRKSPFYSAKGHWYVPDQKIRRRKPRKSIGPKLRYMLYVVFGLVALPSANSVYLAGITFLEWCSQRWGSGDIYKDPMYMWMFLLHLILGVALVAPFVVFGIIHIYNTYYRKCNLHTCWW